MKSGEKTKSQRIANRYYLISILDWIIKESVYHRAHSDNFTEDPIHVNIDAEEIKAAIK